MNTRYRMALGVSPLVLRLALAATFIWAGLAKVATKMEIDANTAAILGNMGVLKPTGAATGGAGVGTSGATDGGTPGSSAPTTPLPPPSEVIEKSDPTEGSVDAGRLHGAAYSLVSVAQEASSPPVTGNGTPAPPAPGAGKYTAADFPEPVSVKPVYLLAASLWMAAHPQAREDGTIPMPLWPPALAEGKLPLIFAVLVLAAELGGGVLVLIGLLTRFAAFSIAMVLAGAMWLTQFGPAIQSGKTVLGFLPDHPAFDGMAWMPLMWLMALFAMALALFFSGPGYMALDHALFGGRRRLEDHDGE